MADTLISKDGLLWFNGKVVNLPEADFLARKHGYMYAEQLVNAIAEKQKKAV